MDSENIDSLLGIGKKAQARKQQRQTARQAKKAKKVDARINRKQSRIDNRQARKTMRIDRRQTRRDDKVANRNMRQQSKIDSRNYQNEMQAVANVNQQELANNSGYADQPTYTDDVNYGYNQAISGVNPNSEHLIKAKRYLQRRNVEPEPDEYLPQQFLEERANHVNQEMEWINEEVETNPYYQNYYEEDLPEYDEIHEDIMAEEWEEFDSSFDSDEFDYIDPVTIGILTGAASKGLDKYREKRFEKGKKFFGKTKEEYEAKKANKGANETAIEAGAKEAAKDASKEIKKKETEAFFEENALEIAGVALLLLFIGRSFK